MCVLDGSATLQDWMVWDKHPIRKQYDVVMDLGAVPCCSRRTSHERIPAGMNANARGSWNSLRSAADPDVDVFSPHTGEGAFSQVVLARHKKTKKLVGLKVVYLQSPEMDEEHLAITRRCVLMTSTSPRVFARALHCVMLMHYEQPCSEYAYCYIFPIAGRRNSCRCWTARASWRATMWWTTACSWCANVVALYPPRLGLVSRTPSWLIGRSGQPSCCKRLGADQMHDG